MIDDEELARARTGIKTAMTGRAEVVCEAKQTQQNVHL